jgi:hypothetical protein
MLIATRTLQFDTCRFIVRFTADGASRHLGADCEGRWSASIFLDD